MDDAGARQYGNFLHGFDFITLALASSNYGACKHLWSLSAICHALWTESDRFGGMRYVMPLTHGAQLK